MRVLLVGDYPPPQGGLAIHVQQVHRFLSERGVQVRALDVGKGGQRIDGVVPVRAARELVRELVRAPEDVVHLHTSGNNPRAWALVAAVGALKAARAVPRFVTLHSGLLPHFLSGARVRRLGARAALMPYEGVVAVSEAVGSVLLSAGVPSSRLHLQPAFMASQVRPGAAPAEFAQVRARRSPLLVYAHHPSPVYGRRAMFAGLRCMAERWRGTERWGADARGVGLAVFGPGTRCAEFLSDARAEGVEELLEDFGELPHAEALAVMKHSDVFIRPTLADGDAISVREALVLGVRCVASDAARRPEGVFTYRTGSAAALADAVERALGEAARWVAGPDVGAFLLAQYGTALARHGVRGRAQVLLSR